jgi:hypothetical protein
MYFWMVLGKHPPFSIAVLSTLESILHINLVFSVAESVCQTITKRSLFSLGEHVCK